MEGISSLHSLRGRLIGSVEPIPREIINGCYVKKMIERFMEGCRKCSDVCVCVQDDSLTRISRDVLIYNKGIS